jgi:Uma2 family endonuclease
MVSVTSNIKTLADLVSRLGGVPLSRILFRPAPGTATLEDVIEQDCKHDKLCELVEGVLVEKAAGLVEALLASFLVSEVYPFIARRNLGIVTGASGMLELQPGLVRSPCIAFTRWDRLPGRRCPEEPIPRLAPNLAVEILRRDNPAGEMAVKRQEYFAAGVELVWEADPRARTIAVYTDPGQATLLTVGDTLDGETVMPDFTMPVKELFNELDRHG